MVATAPTTIASPRPARRTSRRFPSRNATASCIGKRDSGYGISSGSTNEIPAAKRKNAAGPANGNHRRANTGSTRIASAGRQNHSVVVGAPDEPRPSTTLSIATIVSSAVSRSNQYARAGCSIRLTHRTYSPSSRTASHKVRPGIPLKYYPPPNRQPGDDAALATPRPNGAHTLGTTPTLHHWRDARRCRHARPDEAPEPLPVSPPRLRPRPPHPRRCGAHQERPLPIRQLPKQASSPMPVPVLWLLLIVGATYHKCDARSHALSKHAGLEARSMTLGVRSTPELRGDHGRRKTSCFPIRRQPCSCRRISSPYSTVARPSAAQLVSQTLGWMRSSASPGTSSQQLPPTVATTWPSGHVAMNQLTPTRTAPVNVAPFRLANSKSAFLRF